ncbi:MAG: Na+/H+ antiporter NhaA [Porticoccaceae bacterium]|nr:Na+/H+ antiporter NhaA [Porticoccaceae bacterium]
MANIAEEKFEKFRSPFQAFVRDESLASIFLFLAAVLALLAANSPVAEHYFALVHLPIILGLGDVALTFNAHQLINDGLMALFFFVLGLEIKREFLVGELRDPKRATALLAAAIGGMAVPAVIYFIFNQGSSAHHGWGIPMATDSAFALGVLMVLGKRVPLSLKAFLVGYAIIDDLGAIMVIALFYTDSLNINYLGASVACLAVMIGCNIIGIRHFFVYFAMGLLLWGGLMSAGVHGTVAGVLVALVVPARARHGRRWFLRRTQKLIDKVERLEEREILGNPQQHGAVEAVEQAAALATTPLRRWERALEPPVLWLILPLFAFANAGIPLGWERFATLSVSPIAWGIVGGLVIGKTVGISVLVWLTVRLGWGRLPEAVTLTHIVGLALLGGMGFTMSTFIAVLTFEVESELYLAKTGILIASFIAGISGYLWLRFCPDERADKASKEPPVA